MKIDMSLGDGVVNVNLGHGFKRVRIDYFRDPGLARREDELLRRLRPQIQRPQVQQK